ncbi:MAG: 2-dehydropantoate 2-reductase [Candidatus Dormibacteraeota bacterium]|nr:2-dehydropantoate 2-reductase [Candidatus Dormibacteraeota bacterium]
MRTVIVGAGATGGFLGARLARAGEDVVLVARGPHLEAMRSRGIVVREKDGEYVARPECTADLGVIADADVIWLTLKAHGIPAIAPAVGAALRPGATVVSAQNGIPWWYFPDRSLDAVDPGGVIAASIPFDRVVGCVVYTATAIKSPGVIEHIEGNRFSLGEPDGSRSQRLIGIAEVLSRAGLKAPVQTRLRSEIWLKLLGNATLNPVSALTRATLEEMVGSQSTHDLLLQLMHEVRAVALSLGVELEVSPERRLQGAGQVGAHRTSMLQDLDAGRPLEIEALLGAVVELAGDNIAVPGLHTVLELTRLLDRTNRRSAQM